MAAAAADKSDVHAHISEAFPAASSSSSTRDQSPPMLVGDVTQPLEVESDSSTTAQASCPASTSDVSAAQLSVALSEDMDVSDSAANLPSTSTQFKQPVALQPSRSSPAPRAYSAALTGTKAPSKFVAEVLPDSYVIVDGLTATIDIPEDSPAGKQFYSRMDFGVCFDALPDTKLKEYSMALKQILPAGASITHMARKPRAVLVYFALKEHADLVLTEGLSLKDVHLLPEPVSQRPIQVTFYPVPPEVSDVALCTVLSKFGRVVGPVTTLSAAPRDPDDKSIGGFRRSARVIFPSDEHLLACPKVLNVRCGQQRRRIEVTTFLHCTFCHGENHLRVHCPHLASQAPNNSPTTSGPLLSRATPSSTAQKASESKLSQKSTAGVGQRVSTDPLSFDQQLDFPSLNCSLPMRRHSVAESPSGGFSTALIIDTSKSADDGFSGHESRVDESSTEPSLKRRGSSRRRPPKKPTAASPRTSPRTGSTSRKNSPSKAATSSVQADEEPPLKFEDLVEYLKDGSVPTGPISFEDLHQYLSHKTDHSTTHALLSKYASFLPLVHDQIQVLNQCISRLRKEHPWAKTYFNRLKSFPPVVKALQQALMEKSLQDCIS